MPDFDPYHRWLQIPADEQPANHYRLLGLVLYEADADVIENAANQRLAHLRTFQSGPNGPLSQRIINEVTQAKIALLVPETKSAYDAQLQSAIAAKHAAANPFNQINTGASAPTSNATAALPRVVDRNVRRNRIWVLPVAAGCMVVLLLIVAGGIVAVFLLNKSATDNSQETEVAKNDPITNSNPNATPSEQSQASVVEHELIHLVDPVHNLHSGEIELTDDGLTLKKNPCLNRISIPVVPPPEYDLHATVTGSGGVFSFGLPIGSHYGHLSIDGFDDTQLTGMAVVDYRSMGGKEYPGKPHQGQVQSVGEEIDLTISVRKDGVKLLRNDEEIYNWKGDPARLTPRRFYEIVSPYDRCLGFATWSNSQAIVHSLRIVPLGDAATEDDWLASATVSSPIESRGAPVDLLSLHRKELDEKFVLKKPVSIEKNGIDIGTNSSELSGIVFPHDLPAAYDIELQVTNGGNQTLVISPIINGRRAVIDIDGFPDLGKRTWLGGIDGVRGGRSETFGQYAGELMPKGKSVSLKLSVRRNGVRISTGAGKDEREVYRWIGQTRRLRKNRTTRNIPAEFDRYLALMTYRTPILIEKCVLVPVTIEVQ